MINLDYEAVIPIAGGILGALLGYSRTTTVRNETTRKTLRWTSPLLIIFGLFWLLTGFGSASSKPVDAEALAVAMKMKMKLPAQVDGE